MNQPVKYLNNKELLKEINNSKKTYSWFEKDEYSNYDMIVESMDNIDQEILEKVLTKKNDPKNKPNKVYTKEDLVYRVMTDEHIPLDPERKRKPKGIEFPHTKTSFPPFKHFIFKDGEIVEVGRSHWIGSISNGYFSDDHGKISDRLAQMFMLLVEKYSRRGNWRNYCIDKTTEALTQRGWLKHNEINENDKVLSIDMETKELKWGKINSIYRNHNYDDKMFHLTVQGLDALVTPGHKWLTINGPKTTEMLLETDKLILMGDKPVEGLKEKIYSDEFVELISKNKIITMDFLLSLTISQRNILINKILNGKIKRYKQKNIENAEIFALLCTLQGYRCSIKNSKESYIVNIFANNRNKFSRVKNIDFHGGKRSGRENPGKGKIEHQNVPTIDYKGTVWCPDTEYGCFFVKRNGTIYATHNSYRDEFVCFALLQLMQICLQFNESKSENPFAFYTTVIKNSFTRTLNLEKRSQKIRDDILIANGVAPSNTRQIENELEQRYTLSETINKIPNRRGPPKKHQD